MIKALLPPGVFAVEARQDNPEEFLFPAEEKLLGRAVPKRRAEFTTARGCARRALTQLGFPPVPILGAFGCTRVAGCRRRKYHALRWLSRGSCGEV